MTNSTTTNDENDRLKRRIKQLEQSEADLRKNLESFEHDYDQLKSQFKAIPVPLYVWQRVKDDFLFRDYNDAAIDITAGKVVNFLGINAKKMYKDYKPEIFQTMNESYSQEATLTLEVPYLFQSTGNLVFLSLIFTYVKPDLVLVHSQDITEQKNNEDKVQSALLEKETLLKEIHHRVKNNLQIISSILSMQADYTEDEKTLKILGVSRRRIYAMALIHELLYKSGDLQKIDFREYIEDLTSELYSNFLHGPNQIFISNNVSNVSMGIKQAFPLGLLINELVSNAFQYAFINRKKGKISISLFINKCNKVTLIVDDDGVGFPKDIDFHSSETLGLQLVHIISRQLRGTIELDRSTGSNITFTFEAVQTN